MMKIIGLLAVCFIGVVEPWCPPCKRIAQATCTDMNTSGGSTYAVRRHCHGDDHRTCDTICKNLNNQDAQVAKRNMLCFNSLHVYQNRPRFPDGAGFEKLGLKIYRYNTCSRAACGPNYCCCRA
ncbi:unnamed protein product [Owenia fusiformis]|uniref:Uncharacterized protein n=1 Tax=Owenia fusiformis TaxID=6347 RepID=A0A8J1TU60_OWEFU|nr:unnamed protein product [Owenia fusiformis]